MTNEHTVRSGCDIARIRISSSPSREDRIRAYLSDIGDPNHFFCGPVEVQVHFDPHGSPLSELMGRLKDL